MQYIDRLLTPQIASKDVKADKTVKPSGEPRIITGQNCNSVTITEDSVVIRAVSAETAVQGRNYLRQLSVLFDGQLPVCSFEYASPAFPYRGFHLDVCRHFFSVEEIKRLVDIMSMAGYNIFHCHLTDDQGWRFEVEGYPLLKHIASKRDNGEYINVPYSYCGIYSDDDLRSVVSFCAERGVTVIPEVETPGHATALLAAYPQFGCTGRSLDVERRWGIFKDVLNPASEELWVFLDKVIQKFVSIFPGPYIHIGGDECPRDQWNANAQCQALMKAQGLKDADELQGWFTTRIAKMVSSYGKRAMGWDEVVEAPEIDKSVVVMSWRGLNGARVASARGHHVVLCPQSGLYFDRGYTGDSFEPKQWGSFTVRDTFDVDLTMEELPPEQRKLVLGAQCNIWTERISSGRLAEYMMFPRAFVLADSLWLGKNKDWDRVVLRREAMKELCWKMDIVCSPAAWDAGREAEDQWKCV